ncbi:Spi family protease inhibitor [Emticicia sp. 21SJ11W-3]|uniref:Spi family protease inhibitor n=1 Tax=Emticicia sp. 21SJ11W-3 TaxID=2916755 RepID=UPI0038D36A21
MNYEGGGFVVLAADKRIIPILAYSKTGNFEVSKDLTSSIIYWLHTVKEALKEARKTSDKALELWNIKYINRILKSNFDSKLFNSAGKGRETTEPPGEDPGCQFSEYNLGPLMATI